MLCEPTRSDNENKEGYNISGNRVINLKILTTNIENCLVCQQCAYNRQTTSYEDFSALFYLRKSML